MSGGQKGLVTLVISKILRAIAVTGCIAAFLTVGQDTNYGHWGIIHLETAGEVPSLPAFHFSPFFSHMLLVLDQKCIWSYMLLLFVKENHYITYHFSGA